VGDEGPPGVDGAPGPPGPGGGGAVLAWGTQTTTTLTGDFLRAWINATTGLATETPGSKILAPRAGILRNAFVIFNQAAGVAATSTFTVRINGADTAIVIAVADPGLTGSDTAHSAVVAAGDAITVRCDFTGLTPGAVSFSLEYDAT
jgi:hypothetical protein